MNAEYKLDVLTKKVDCLIRQIKIIAVAIAFSTIIATMSLCHILTHYGLTP